MAAEHVQTDELRGATFRQADLAGATFRQADLAGATFRQVDLTGATFRECDLSQVRIVGSLVADLVVAGFDGEAGRVVVDDVDVTAFVAAELDARHPERVQLRAVRSADDHRAMWGTVERLWSDTVSRAEALPEAARHERVDDEWSLVETLRHLVFAIDSWVGNLVLGGQEPYHPLGQPPTDFEPAAATALGIDLDARPMFAEAVAIHGERMAQVRSVVASLTDAELGEVRTGVLMPGEEPEQHAVGECLHVVLREHCEHRRFAERDLAVLAGR